jgi:hypothetical protein
MQSKLVVTALGAFGFGAVFGWAVTRDACELRLREEKIEFIRVLREAKNEINLLNDYVYALRTRQEEDSAKDSQPDFVDFFSAASEESIATVEVPADADEDEDDSNILPGETPEETRSNLQALIDNYTDPDNRDRFVDLANRTEAADQLPPFVIDRATYAWDEEGEDHAKVTLTYYPRDRVLLDDDEDPIDDIPGTVGWRSLNQFGGESGDPDVVFVRNRRLSTDFEVIREEDEELPLHVKYGMPKEEFRVNKAAGTLKLRQEDQ